jgi:Chaperone of endosialidase
VRNLNPVTFTYKVDASEKHVGFIAEDISDLVATRNRKGMSPMDVVAILAKVVEEQQEINRELMTELATLNSKVE